MVRISLIASISLACCIAYGAPLTAQQEEPAQKVQEQVPPVELPAVQRVLIEPEAMQRNNLRNAPIRLPAYANARPTQEITFGSNIANIVIAKVIPQRDGPELAIAKFKQIEPTTGAISFRTEMRMRTVIVDGKEVQQTYSVNVPVVTNVASTPNNVSFVAETRTRTINVDGKQVEQNYTVMVPVVTNVSNKPKDDSRFVPDEQSRTHPAKLIQAFDVKGNRLELEVWTKRLEKPTHVLLLKSPLTDENRLDPFCAAVLKEDTLLLYMEAIKEPAESEPSKTAPAPPTPATDKPKAKVPGASTRHKKVRALGFALPIFPIQSNWGGWRCFKLLDGLQSC